MDITKSEKNLENKLVETQEKVTKDNILLIFNKIPNKKISFYQIDLSFPNIYSENKDPEEFEFVLEINLTNKQIRLFSKNLNLVSDGRDLFPLVFSQNILPYFNKDELPILEITRNITNFLQNFHNDNTTIVNKQGKFYLGFEYSPNIINNLKEIDIFNCKHIDIVNGHQIEIISVCTISNSYFCLYEHDKISKKLILVFYAALKTLITFRKSKIGSIVTLLWKKFKDKDVEEVIKICSPVDDDMEKVMYTLIDKFKDMGFQMDIKKPKKGELPKVNFGKLQKEISRLEAQLDNRENVLVFNKLMESYEKAIVYLSAANNNLYLEYNKRLQYLLKNEKYSKFIK